MSYTWDWGDGVVEEGGATASHTYAEPGSYQITATPKGGSPAQAEATVPHPTIDLPPAGSELDGPTPVSGNAPAGHTIELSVGPPGALAAVATQDMGDSDVYTFPADYDLPPGPAQLSVRDTTDDTVPAATIDVTVTEPADEE